MERPKVTPFKVTCTLPAEGFLREKQIVGDPKAIPPKFGLIPISRGLWWDGVKKGIYPKPVKLSERTTAWRVSDIVDLINRINGGGE